MAEAWTELDVAVEGLHGTLTLPGTLALPKTLTLPYQAEAAVLILPGSGPVDRNGNLPNLQNDSLQMLARGLAGRGIASLRIDKRGIGESLAKTTAEQDLRIATYVADAITWLAFLRGRLAVARVVLLGHSEGALIASLAAQQVDLAGLILVAGAGVPAAQLIERQMVAAEVPAHLLARARDIDRALQQGIAVAEVPPELAALYRPGVQAYLMSWFALDPVQELRRS